MLVDPGGLHRVGKPAISAGAALKIENSKLKALHALWNAQCTRATLPARTAFGFDALRAWLGHIALIEVLSEPRQFRVRLFGSTLVKLAGRDLTAQWLDKSVPDDRVGAVLEPYYACVKEKTAVAQLQRYEGFGAKPPVLEQLLLPCSSDQTSIDTIVVGAYLDGDTVWSS